jgi:hypothetical protein
MRYFGSTELAKRFFEFDQKWEVSIRGGLPLVGFENFFSK